MFCIGISGIHFVAVVALSNKKPRYYTRREVICSQCVGILFAAANFFMLCREYIGVLMLIDSNCITGWKKYSTCLLKSMQ